MLEELAMAFSDADDHNGNDDDRIITDHSQSAGHFASVCSVRALRCANYLLLACLCLPSTVLCVELLIMK